mmetsp:Transcript_114560/g.203046  ORF Transcript_114560/g.203046 Transcript_114560/m.203046 type:complete len:388 (+) Transcript_114560:55-1218(+)
MVRNFRTKFCCVQHLVCFLLCIGLQASSEDAISEMPHEHLCGHDGSCDDTVSMLQFRTEHPRTKASKRPIHPLGSWVFKDFHIVVQHKSGTVMSYQAAYGMLNALAGYLPVYWAPPIIDVPWLSLGIAPSEELMQTPTPACHVHMARNPFELIVSDYMYHMGNAEPEWTEDVKFGDTLDLDDCPAMLIDGRMSQYCLTPGGARQPYWLSLWLKGIENVYHRSRSGNLSAWLPDVMANESWSGYLQRVDTDAGLIANVIWTSTTTMPALKTSHDFMESQPCSLNVCFNEWYDDCNAAWSRVLTAWQIEEPGYAAMLAGAKKSCPEGNIFADEHSSDYNMKERGVQAEEPSWRMVKRLKELDLLLFNGSIASLEKHITCPVSGKYKEPL